MADKKNHYVSDECFILRMDPHKETSLLLEVLSRHHGRLRLIAKGARRPRSELRGHLLMFQALQLKWYGTQELKNLVGIEWLGRGRFMFGHDLNAAFYLSELLVLFLPWAAADERVFYLYQDSLDILQSSQHKTIRRAVRIFECNMLHHAGILPNFRVDAQHAEINPHHEYVFLEPGLPIRSDRHTDESRPYVCRLPGAILLRLHVPSELNDQELEQCKVFFQWMIRCYNTRHVLSTRLGHELRAIRERVMSTL